VSGPTSPDSAVGRFAVSHAVAIAFITAVLCMAGAYSAFRMPSSLFPKTDFPRCVILVDNGIMPVDEMMAVVTRPIEEAMKDVPGSVSVRSVTNRGTAEINVFFTWQSDMEQAELAVSTRLASIRSTLPSTAATAVWRLNFSAFPVLGVAVTSPTREASSLWEKARYEIKPRLLRISGVGRVDLIGGSGPEFVVSVDPIRLAAASLDFPQLAAALSAANILAPAGYHEENHSLYLTVVDGRAQTEEEIAGLVITARDGHPVRIRDFARVERRPAPAYNRVTSDGVSAVLLNVRSQQDGSTLAIADGVRRELDAVRAGLPPGMKLTVFYDQSEMVRSAVRSVWEAIIFGLLLSIAILYLFLKQWGATLTASLVIPATVLITLLCLKAVGAGFNLMTLGGIAAAIGLIIDDAIVVVEAIHARLATGGARLDCIREAIGEIFRPLVASTLTPVVAFAPLALLEGLPGIFFRALALTMVIALLTSLLLALTLTPSLTLGVERGLPKALSEVEGRARWLRDKPRSSPRSAGPILTQAIQIYERAIRFALARRAATLVACAAVLAAGVWLTRQLKTDFLPPMDEGGFVVDYAMPPGTSLQETNRQLLQVEATIRGLPEVASYSRRTGARLGLAISEPNTGDILVKLRADRKRSTSEVMSWLRHQLSVTAPNPQWDLHDILGDLIGNLTADPRPIEVRLYSSDIDTLRAASSEVADVLGTVKGVVDISNGQVVTGPTLSFHLRPADAARFGFTAQAVASAVELALQGVAVSHALDGDRTIAIRVRAEPAAVAQLATLRQLPLRTATGDIIQLAQVADVFEEPGQVELRREDLRQEFAVTAGLEGNDIGRAMAEIRTKLEEDENLSVDAVEYGGLYQQQREAFRNLLVVLIAATLLVFTVLVVEFRSLRQPSAIVFGAILALFGTVAALWLTGTSLNVVSYLGAIIGVGIVAKNGILMLDFVDRLRANGLPLTEALVQSGRRRLRPVLMTSLAAALGMLPLALGLGSGADMLRPLAIAVIGALTISVLLSLVATPVMYSVLVGQTPRT